MDNKKASSERRAVSSEQWAGNGERNPGETWVCKTKPGFGAPPQLIYYGASLGKRKNRTNVKRAKDGEILYL
jgi:hypothetical protein